MYPRTLLMSFVGLLALSSAVPVQERAEDTQERSLVNFIAKKYNADLIEGREPQPMPDNDVRSLVNFIAKKYNADLIDERSNEERALVNFIAKKYNADLIEE